MSQKRKIIHIDEELCDGCGQCVPACEEGAIQIVDGKAKLIRDRLCDGLGNCLGECPRGAIQMIEREAEEFDEEAVRQQLQKLGAKNQEQPQRSGCPSAQLQDLSSCSAANVPREQAAGSALSHWPVKIRLVPPHAPFLQNADLLVTADCAPVAASAYHNRYLPGRVALLGCPKFDDAEAYVRKFTDIFQQAGVNSVTVLSMEVPCCSGLVGMVRRAREIAGANVSVTNTVLTLGGQVKQEEAL
jgi:NAD-dependent dihydropyrimidine dehydrogenase PreA subunit